MKQASVAVAKNIESTTERRIEPLFNDAFVRIFGSRESANLTRGLINSILGKVGIEPIGQVDSIVAEHTSVVGSIECKTPRIDVKLVSANRVFDLESQCYTDDVENRSLLYGSKLLVENTSRGTKYNELPQVVVITLLDDKPLHPDSNEYIHRAQMQWSDGSSAFSCTDRMIFILVELQKVRERYNQLSEDVLADETLAWMYLLTTGFEEKWEVDAIVDEFPTIEEFAELYGIALNDPKIKIAYEDFESAEREYDSRQRYLARIEREAAERGMERGLAQGLERGLEQGLEQGLKRGRKETLEEVAAKLRAAGASEDLVAAIIE